MGDIYDIKTNIFWFIYSIDYLFIIWTIVFLVLFYFLVNYFFNFNNTLIRKVENISDDNIKNRFKYLIENIEKLSREIFYREVSLFIKMLIYKKFKDKSVFFMTLSEIEKYFKNEYNFILKEVYYLEFNKNLEDNFKVRKGILKKIEIFL